VQGCWRNEAQVLPSYPGVKKEVQDLWVLRYWESNELNNVIHMESAMSNLNVGSEYVEAARLHSVPVRASGDLNRFVVSDQ
jgi:hypothetical protein